MYIKLNGIPGSSSLDNFGLDTTQFDDPFVIHGGEGFAHITGDGDLEVTQEWALLL